MMRKSIIVLVAVCALISFSCAKKMNEVDTLSQDAELQAESSIDLYSNGTAKLIKTAHYRFQVVSVKASAEAIESAIKKYPAFISASDMKLENPTLENKMTIRVQHEFFQDLLKEIDKQATYVNFRNVSTEDVGKQFVDLESRLSTKREVEKRYAEILRTKAGTIQELLEAEKQIGALHEEIEATVSKINYLRDEVQYSTIQLEFYQTIDSRMTASNDIPTTNRFLDALGTGWIGVVDLTIGLLYFWPLLLVAGVAMIGYFRRKKKRIGLAG